MVTDPNRVKEIFLEAVEQPDVAARVAYLGRACGGDAGLRERVEAILRSHDTADSFLGSPAVKPPEPHELATQGLGSAATPEDANQAEDLKFLDKPCRPDSLGRIGHYEMLQVLGRGSFGIVFRAFDDMLQRVVAIKVMAPQVATLSPARKRFLREARSSAAVRHENVVQVYEVGEQPLPYLAMEFIPGETLKQKLDRCGPLDVPEVLRIGRQVAEGLAAAHACDLIHRDIKPGNILLESGAHRAKITDFGLARAADDASISQSGIIAGTPMFMAPEQALGHKIDQRADLFSLGSVLYQMASGRPPFRAPSALAVLKRVAEEPPRPIPEIIPETPDWLCGIITKLHAKNPADRFQSAREVADLLADCEAKLKAKQEVKNVLPAAVKPAGRKWVAAAAVVLLPVIALVVTEFAGVTHLFRQQARTNSIQAGPEPTPAAPGTDWLRETASCAGHKGPVHGVVFGPEGKFLASAGADKSVRIWSPDQGKELRSLEFQSGDDGAVAVVGNLLVAGGQDYAFTGWDVNTWQKAFAFVDHPGWSVHTLAPHKTGFLSCGRTDGGFHFWDFAGKNGGGWFTTGGSMPWSAAVRLDGQRIIVGLDSGAIDFWIDRQIVTEQPKKVVLTGHTGAVRVVSYSPTGTTFASAGVDGSIKLWNGEDGKELATLTGHAGAVLALAYSPDGKYLVSGGADRTVGLWDIDTGKLAGAPLTLSATVNALAWSADDRTLATGCDDGSVKLWQIKLPASPVPVAKQQPQQPTYKNGIGMEFVIVPKGKSRLGGGKDKLGDKEVEIPADFYLGKYEVTQEEWEKVMGENPSHFSRTGAGKDAVKDIADADLKRFPVETVTWDQCQIFVEKLNRLEKETGWVYRLPKEAEWEYACRGGPMSDKLDSAFDFYFTKPTNTLLPEQANFKDNGVKRTCNVGSYEANPLRLHDMHGNVWEWCDDTEKAADGASLRVYRGGCLHDDSGHCQAASRLTDSPSHRHHALGLRLARVPSGVPSPEAKTPPLAVAPFTDADVKRIAALPAAEQLEEVRKELVRRNPGFDGKVGHKIENGVVTEFRIVTDQVTDILPIRVFNALRVLDCSGTHTTDWHGNGQLVDLTPLKGMNLAGLAVVRLHYTRVGDAGLAHFRDCKRLADLNLCDTQVGDAGLAHFKGMPLRVLRIYRTGVTDLSPLQGMPLEDVRLTPKNISRGLDILRDMKSLKTIGIEYDHAWPAAEFWERYDKGEFKE